MAGSYSYTGKFYPCNREAVYQPTEKTGTIMARLLLIKWAGVYECSTQVPF